MKVQKEVMMTEIARNILQKAHTAVIVAEDGTEFFTHSRSPFTEEQMRWRTAVANKVVLPAKKIMLAQTIQDIIDEERSPVKS